MRAKMWITRGESASTESLNVPTYACMNVGDIHFFSVDAGS